MAASSSRNDPICLLSDSDDDDDNDNPPPPSRKRSAPDPPISSSSNDRFTPFRLYTTSNDVAGGTAGGSKQRAAYTSTLREMIGLDDSFAKGEGRQMKWIVIINFLIDFDFLIDEIPELLSLPRVVVLYGSPMNASGPLGWQNAACDGTVDFIRLVPSDPKNSAYNPLPFKMEWGVHHTKMFLVGYDDGTLRVVVHTSNLRRTDFENNCQGSYVQDYPLKAAFRRRCEDATADSSSSTASSSGSTSMLSQSQLTKQHCSGDDLFATSSQFEEDLIAYLDTYRQQQRYFWPLDGDSTSSSTPGQVPLSLTEVLHRYDYSSAYGVLIASVPGYHRLRNCPWGHIKLRDTIRRHTTTTTRSTKTDNGNDNEDETRLGGPIIAQFSSLGSFSLKWMHELASSLDIQAARSSSVPALARGATSSPLLDKLKLVWPTVEEVRTSAAGYSSGGPIPGRTKNVDKPFLTRFYHRWSSVADPMRKKSYPGHIKTFLQLSQDETEVEWCLLTSHNLSTAALGQIQNNSSMGEKVLFTRHWELGVFISADTLENANHQEGAATDSSTKRSKDVGGSVTFGKQRLRLVPFTGNNTDYGPNDIILPLPFDTSPTRYSSHDIPWATDRKCALPDAYGLMFG